LHLLPQLRSCEIRRLRDATRADIVHIAAAVQPGFAVDEALDSLGRDLKRPVFLEPRRKEIQAVLPRLDTTKMQV
jgi:hypothetical protein